MKKQWFPDPVHSQLRLDYVCDKGMRLSCQTVCQYIYVLPCGELNGAHPVKRPGVMLVCGKFPEKEWGISHEEEGVFN